MSGHRLPADLLGVAPAHGRLTRWEETWEGSEEVVVLSHRGFQRLGGDPALVGSRLTLNGDAVTVIGVTPPGFRLHDADPEIWLPTAWSPDSRGQAWFRRAHWIRPIARLAPGVTIEQATAELEAVAARLQVEYPETNRLMGAGLTPLRSWLVDDTRQTLWILLGAGLALLLIACANAGHLLLARSAAREHDLAVLRALGASRARIVRQLLAESALLSASSALLGTALAVLLLDQLRRHAPTELPRFWELALGPWVLVATAGVVVLTTLACGLAPALIAGSRNDSSGDVRGRTQGRAEHRIRRLLVTLEVATALVLAVLGGSFLRSLDAIGRVDTGFETEQVLSARVPLPRSEYDPAARGAFFAQLAERAAGLASVRSTGLIDALPIAQASWTTSLMAEGGDQRQQLPEVMHRTIDHGYFPTMGVDVLAGRNFLERESVPVVILNRTAAERAFGGADPIGGRVTQDTQSDDPPWLEVVGVVEDEKQVDLREDPRPQMYEPMHQDPGDSTITVVLRTSGDPEAVAGPFRELVAELDSNVPVEHVATMSTVLRDSLDRERFFTWLTGAFAVLALTLASVGVYSVIAVWVSARERELGVRRALGARVGDLSRLILGQGMSAVWGGLVLGLVTSVALARLVSGVLYGVSITDPVSLGMTAGLVGLVAACACVVPVGRASRLDPQKALRAD